MSKTLQLVIITQEKELLSEEVSQVTLPAEAGQMTVLPGHIPVFSKLSVGELTYKIGDKSTTIIVSQGFIDVAPNNKVTVLTDSATHERDVTLQQAEEAKKKAEEAMLNKADERDFLIAEASLKKALLEMKFAQKRKQIP